MEHKPELFTLGEKLGYLHTNSCLSVLEEGVDWIFIYPLLGTQQALAAKESPWAKDYRFQPADLQPGSLSAKTVPLIGCYLHLPPQHLAHSLAYSMCSVNIGKMHIAMHICIQACMHAYVNVTCQEARSGTLKSCVVRSHK